MTAPDPIDLDHLDALYAAATPGYSGAFGDKGLRYRMRDGVHEVSGCNRDGLSTYIADFSDRHDAKFYIALHNAWPAVSAELRRLRAELAEARAGRMTVDLTNLPKHRSSWFSDATGLGDKQGDDDGN